MIHFQYEIEPANKGLVYLIDIIAHPYRGDWVLFEQSIDPGLAPVILGLYSEK
jgi:hypothetical protein